jgi:hypothetical protein
MPSPTTFTFSVEPVARRGRVTGYVAAGFFTRKQLVALHSILQSNSLKRIKKLRMDNKSMDKGMKEAIQKATG